ncbi:MAG: PqqD family protein [Betaproteobacteria bacterium]
MSARQVPVPAMTDPQSAARYALNQPPVVGEVIDGEVMVINLDTGVYYSVTGAGAAVWPMLVGGATRREISDRVARHYGASAASVERDLGMFIAQLADEAILRLRQDDVAAGPFDAVDGWPAVTYPGFGFERYDDMQALLVIDPVHEVGNFGWPSRSADDSEKA